MMMMTIIIIHIEKYLNTKYKEDQFVNIVKSHETNQHNMNSTIKTAARIKPIK
jgi:hypothetical protein